MAVLNITIEDGKGERATMTHYMSDLLDADFTGGMRYESAADNILQDLEPVIDGRIVEASWSIPVGLDFTPQTASAGCDVEEGAKFTWETAGGWTSSVRIPTFKESLLVAGTNLVDMTAAAVIDYVQTILDGPDAVPGVTEDRQPMTDYRGDVIAFLVGAAESFVKRRLLKTILRISGA